MKRFVFVLLVNFLLVDGRKLSNWENEEENLPLDLTETSKKCHSNKDCGEFDCCFQWTKRCYKKPDEGDPCSQERSVCPCRPGLECTVHKEFDGQKFYRCLKPDIDIIA